MCALNAVLKNNNVVDEFKKSTSTIEICWSAIVQPSINYFLIIVCIELEQEQDIRVKLGMNTGEDKDFVHVLQHWVPSSRMHIYLQ